MSGSVSSYSSNPVLALRQANRPGQETRDLARIGKEPDLARTMAQFTQAVNKAPDIKTALRDPRVLSVLGKALGLPEAENQTGIAVRALLADTSDTSSLPNQLSDKRWLEMAKTLNLAKNGIAGLRDPKLQATLLEGLKSARRMDELNNQTAGVGDALLFEQSAAKAKTSIDVLGDPILRRVVTGALGLPREIAVQSLEAQMKAIDSRFSIAKLQNPKEVQKLAERYLTNLAIANSSSDSKSSSGLAAYGFNV